MHSILSLSFFLFQSVPLKKERLDALLTAKGLFESRAKAQAAIMAGQILVNEQKIYKPGTQVPEVAAIRLLGD